MTRPVTSIGRLVARPPVDAAGPHLGRAWVDRQLDGLDLAPAGLAHDAVLVVRKLSVEARPGWQAGVRAELGQFVASAVRPAAGMAVPVDDVAAVVFGDEPELLACLTVDVLEGRVAERWWWRRVGVPAPVGSTGRGAALAAAWSARASSLPATLARLPSSVARRAMACLSVEDAGRVVATVAGAWRLPDAVAAAVLGRAAGGATAAETEASRGAAPSGAARPAPWQQWLPAPTSAGTSLAPFAERLLGLCLVLHHAPATAAAPSFAEAVAVAGSEPVDRAPDLDGPTPAPAAGPVPVPPMPVEGVATRFGGVLYLLHVLEWLSFPWAWDDEAAANLGGWGALEAVGRALLPDAHDDPLWGVLGGLAERPDDEPLGAGLVAPTSEPAPPSHVAERLTTYPAAGPPLPVDPDAMSDGAAFWAGRIGAVAEMLLAAAGCSRDVLAAPGLVVATPTHVDLYLGFDGISLPARAAGLDRDPGWLPAFGRIVLFHFGQEAPRA